MHTTWAVTAYFNPLRWRSRRQNFDIFRAALRDDVPLCVVEWSPTGEFELGQNDAELLLQVGGGDLLWQKERLLNLGVEAIDDEVAFVALLDADTLFPGQPIAIRVQEALREADFAQLFGRSYALGEDEQQQLRSTGTLPARANLAFRKSLLTHFLEADDRRRCVRDFLMRRRERLYLPPGPADEPIIRQSPSLEGGIAWAVRRDWLRRVGGLFDRFIIGGADTLIVSALLGIAGELVDSYAEAGVDCYRCAALAAWLAALEGDPARLGAVDGDVIQLYHGLRADRQYTSRHRRLAETGVDLDEHLTRSGSGVWAFAGNSPPALHDLMRDYFRGRREDQ